MKNEGFAFLLKKKKGQGQIVAGIEPGKFGLKYELKLSVF